MRRSNPQKAYVPNTDRDRTGPASLRIPQKQPLCFHSPSGGYTGHENLGWFGTKYQSLNIVATYTLIYKATFMVEQGMGVAFCLNNLVDITGSRNLTFRPFYPEIKVDSYIVTKKYQVFSPAVKLFIDRLQNK